MQVKIKKIVKSKIKINPHSKGKDFGNDPFFVKKAKESKAFLEKSGFPESAPKKK
jgi:hypothetical protein